MNTDTFVPKHQWSPPAFAPDDLPAPWEDTTTVEDEEFTVTDEEVLALRPHSFPEYCEHSRYVARIRGFSPAYIGYAFIPQRPQGVCH